MPTKPNFDRGSYTTVSRDQTTAEAKRKFEDERAKMGSVIFDGSETAAEAKRRFEAERAAMGSIIFDATDTEKTKWRTKDFNADIKTDEGKEDTRAKADQTDSKAGKLKNKVGNSGTTLEEQQAGTTAETLNKVAEGTTTRESGPKAIPNQPSGYETSARENVELAAQALGYIPDIIDGGKYLKEIYDSYFPEGISLNPQEFSVVDAQLPRQKFTDTRKSGSVKVTQGATKLYQDALPMFGGDMGTCPIEDIVNNGTCPAEEIYYPTPARAAVKAPQEADYIWRLKHGVKAPPKQVDTEKAYRRSVKMIQYAQSQNGEMLSGNRQADEDRNMHFSDIEASKIVDASAPPTGGKKMIFPIGKLQRTTMQGTS